MNWKNEEPWPDLKIPWLDEAIRLARKIGFYGKKGKGKREELHQDNGKR